jgi:CSLREA domain-containing protein
MRPAIRPARWFPAVGLSFLLLASAAAAAPTFTVNSTFDAPGADTMGATLTDGVCETQHGNGICTLRAAIMEANHVPGGGAAIRLPPGTYAIGMGPVGAGSERDGSFDLLAPMTIIGEGPSVSIVDGNNLDQVFDVSGDPVVLQGIGVRRGLLAGFTTGSGIVNTGNLTLENVALVENGDAGDSSRGIRNLGTVSIRQSVIQGNFSFFANGGGSRTSEPHRCGLAHHGQCL